ncbi:MAG: hypothetical protein QXX68_00365 [Candidatus Pacearchaeota archaeon]
MKDNSVKRREGGLSHQEDSFVGRWWDIYKPRNFYERIFMLKPELYIIWKMPEDTHRKLNSFLDTLTPVVSSYAGPEAGIAVGVIDGVSHLMYGLKTFQKNKDPGKHVVGGLSKIAEGIDKMKIKDKDKILGSIDDIVRNDFDFVTYDSSSKSGPIAQS